MLSTLQTGSKLQSNVNVKADWWQSKFQLDNMNSIDLARIGLNRDLRMYNTYLKNCRQTSNIMRTLVGNKIVDHSDVVGASPGGAAPTTSLFST